ncbi:MAG: succinylglutamate-semialdehyde dehydrogenase [Pseudomonadota bacterium]|jgi:succinylglutamic semialdehyde dehydrogenase
MRGQCFINGVWRDGNGPAFDSFNPADGGVIWTGAAADSSDVDAAVSAAQAAFTAWRRGGVEHRMAVINQFVELLKEHSEALADIISRETGKVLWDAKGEVAAMIGKAAISERAYHERTGVVDQTLGGIQARLVHNPLGVMAVFGPYNFPCHLPNGHIIPALIAGNTVVFKPSELTPLCAEFTLDLWHRAGLPAGVINLIPGAASTGIALSQHPGLAGILFTGSAETGRAIHRQLAGQPEKMLALEMGGNNPLIVESAQRIDAAVQTTIQSAFVSSGQRCTCARRLIVPRGEWGDAFLSELVDVVPRLNVGAWNAQPAPFMGPLIAEGPVQAVLNGQRAWCEAGGDVLVEARRLEAGACFVSPGIVDVTNIWRTLPDKEIFGPLLQVIRVADMEEALEVANTTQFGLSAGLISESRQQFDVFLANIIAGVVNWNRPLTGASGAMPFGGPGASGNLRPSAYYAADYCAYPVASMYSEACTEDDNFSRFLT